MSQFDNKMSPKKIELNYFEAVEESILAPSRFSVGGSVYALSQIMRPLNSREEQSSLRLGLFSCTIQTLNVPLTIYSSWILALLITEKGGLESILLPASPSDLNK